MASLHVFPWRTLFLERKEFKSLTLPVKVITFNIWSKTHQMMTQKHIFPKEWLSQEIDVGTMARRTNSWIQSNLRYWISTGCKVPFQGKQKTCLLVFQIWHMTSRFDKQHQWLPKSLRASTMLCRFGYLMLRLFKVVCRILIHAEAWKPWLCQVPADFTVGNLVKRSSFLEVPYFRADVHIC